MANYLYMDDLPRIFANLVTTHIASFDQHVGVIQFIMFSVAALAVLPATFFMGATFPLTIRIVSSGLDRIGRDVGSVYALNTLGAIAGSFLSAFADHPRIKREKTQGRFVYYCAERSVYAEQQQRRCELRAKGRPPTSFEVIAILVEKIKRPALSSEALSRRLRKQKVSVEAETIERRYREVRAAWARNPHNPRLTRLITALVSFLTFTRSTILYRGMWEDHWPKPPSRLAPVLCAIKRSLGRPFARHQGQGRPGS